MPKITELKPSHIRIADALLCKNPDIQTISLNDFESKVAKHRQIPKFNWIEHVESDTKNNDTLIIEEALFLEMKVATQQLVICRMGEQRLGVFTSQKIKKGTVLTLYSGEYKDMKTFKGDPYAYRVNDHIVTSGTCGNIASFIQHMPSPESHIHYFEGVAFANVQAVPCGDNLLIKALRDIEPNEMLGLDYSIDYWVAKKTSPIYFDRYGNDLGNLNMRISIYVVYERLYSLVQAILGSTYKTELIEKLCLECEAEIKQVFKMEKPWDGVQNRYRAQCEKITIDAARMCKLELPVEPLVSVALSGFMGMHKDVLKLVPRKYRPLIDSFFNTSLVKQNRIENHHPLSLGSFLETGIVHHPDRPEFCTRVGKLSLPKDYYNFNDARYHYGSPDFLVSEDKVALTKGNEAYKQEKYESAIQWWQKYLKKLRTDQSKTEHYAVENQLFPATKEICIQFWNLGRAYQKSGNLIEAEYCMLRALRGAEHLQLSQAEKYREGWREVKNSLDPKSSHASVFPNEKITVQFKAATTGQLNQLPATNQLSNLTAEAKSWGRRTDWTPTKSIQNVIDSTAPDTFNEGHATLTRKPEEAEQIKTRTLSHSLFAKNSSPIVNDAQAYQALESKEEEQYVIVEKENSYRRLP